MKNITKPLTALALPFLLPLLLISPPALAHKINRHKHHGHDHAHHHGEGHDHGLKLEEIPLEEREAEELRQLLEDAHHSIEDEHGGTLLQRYRGKFNLKRTVLDAYRWYAMHQGEPHVANAAANVATLLVASHGLESLLGAGLVSLGATGDLDDLVRMGAAAVGITITIPGLDPICLVAVGSYRLWPRTMNRLLSKPRLFIVKSSEFAHRLAGLPDGWFSFLFTDHRRARLLRSLSAQSRHLQVTPLEDGAEFRILDLNGPGEAVLRATRDPESGLLGLRSVRFSDPPIAKAALNRGLKPFGINIRSAVLDLMSRDSTNDHDLAHIPYVRGVEREAGQKEILVQFNPLAFPLYRISHEDLCACALQAHCTAEPLPE